MGNEKSFEEVARSITACCSKCGVRCGLHALTMVTYAPITSVAEWDGQVFSRSDNTEKYAFCPECFKKVKECITERVGENNENQMESGIQN